MARLPPPDGYRRGGPLTRRVNGIVGSVGVDGAVTIGQGLDLALRARAGSAYLLGAGVSYTWP